MSAAYVDTSCLVAIAFREPGWAKLADRLDGFGELFSANLLEAELRAAFTRESVDGADALLAGIGWVLPDRALSGEITQVLALGYARGADLWHLACALYLAEPPGDLAFLTLDARQAELAGRLGFAS